MNVWKPAICDVQVLRRFSCKDKNGSFRVSFNVHRLGHLTDDCDCWVRWYSAYSPEVFALSPSSLMDDVIANAYLLHAVDSLNHQKVIYGTFHSTCLTLCSGLCGVWRERLGSVSTCFRGVKESLTAAGWRKQITRSLFSILVNFTAFLFIFLVVLVHPIL